MILNLVWKVRTEHLHPRYGPNSPSYKKKNDFLNKLNIAVNEIYRNTKLKNAFTNKTQIISLKFEKKSVPNMSCSYGENTKNDN